MAQRPEIEEEPPQVRQLRLLVMVLIVVLILGFLTIVGVIVIRLGLGGASGQGVAAPEIALPAGTEVLATGQGPGTVHFLVRTVTGTQHLLVFNAETGQALSRTAVTMTADQLDRN